MPRLKLPSESKDEDTEKRTKYEQNLNALLVEVDNSIQEQRDMKIPVNPYLFKLKREILQDLSY